MLFLFIILSFVTIPLKPLAAEGPGITLFQRNLLLAYNEIDSELAEAALKYFYDHAQQWVTPINVTISVHAEVSPYCVEAEQVIFQTMWMPENYLKNEELV